MLKNPLQQSTYYWTICKGYRPESVSEIDCEVVQPVRQISWSSAVTNWGELALAKRICWKVNNVKTRVIE
jgi:hypothetical protein